MIKSLVQSVLSGERNSVSYVYKLIPSSMAQRYHLVYQSYAEWTLISEINNIGVLYVQMGIVINLERPTMVVKLSS